MVSDQRRSRSRRDAPQQTWLHGSALIECIFTLMIHDSFCNSLGDQFEDLGAEHKHHANLLLLLVTRNLPILLVCDRLTLSAKLSQPTNLMEYHESQVGVRGGYAGLHLFSGKAHCKATLTAPSNGA